MHAQFPFPGFMGGTVIQGRYFLSQVSAYLN